MRRDQCVVPESFLNPRGNSKTFVLYAVINLRATNLWSRFKKMYA